MRIPAAIILWIALSAAAPEPDWRSAAIGDINAAYQLYHDNHPGWFDPANPRFRSRLTQARRAGLAAASRAHDYGGYSQALDAFATIMADGHAGFQSSRRGTISREWTGFTAAWRGGELRIFDGTPSAGVPAGARIVSCDGTPARSLILRRLGTRGLRPTEAGQWWFHATRLFTDSAVYVKPRPNRCTFAVGKRLINARLNWTAAPADLDSRLRAAAEGEKTPIGLTEPRPGIYLVGLPDFNPNPDGVAAYRHLFAELKDRHAELDKARAIILDLRWNNGGSSTWPRQTAQALWGQDAVDQRLAYFFRRVEVWWRASPQNLAYMSTIESTNRANGNIKVADRVHETAAGMQAAIGRKQPLFVERNTDPVPAPTAAPNFHAPVYVITPGACASACLDAVDIFKQFRNVKLIGAPTSADSTYLEARTADLPSGEAKASIPVKIWVHRPRGAGQFYMPDIAVNDLSWSTKAFLDAVEKDLKRR